jgi:hypothetical protein
VGATVPVHKMQPLLGSAVLRASRRSFSDQCLGLQKLPDLDFDIARL